MQVHLQECLLQDFCVKCTAEQVRRFYFANCKSIFKDHEGFLELFELFNDGLSQNVR